MRLKEQLAYRDAFLAYLSSDYDSWEDKAQIIVAASKIIKFDLPPQHRDANLERGEYADPIRDRT